VFNTLTAKYKNVYYSGTRKILVLFFVGVN